jgi:tRNASer (uridine44-2'-O)-methyltransferase
MGYVVEKEHLRIPSTRNIAVVGRKMVDGNRGQSLGGRLQFAREVVEKEMGGEVSIEQVRMQWVARGSGLMKPGKGGH